MITTVNSYAWGETLERYSDIGSRLKEGRNKRHEEQRTRPRQVQTETVEIRGPKLYIREIRDEVALDSIWWKLVVH